MDFRIILDYCVCEEVDVNKDVSVYYDLLHTKSVPILPCPFQPLLNIHNNMGNDGSVLNLKKYNWRGGKSQQHKRKTMVQWRQRHIEDATTDTWLAAM
jgi:hypothetical protein